MSKIVKTGLEVLTKFKSGINKLAKAVEVTLGPSGKYVILERTFGSPHVTKDGVTVSMDVDSSDPIENIAITIGKDVTQKIGKSAGDGTSTSTCILNALMDSGYNNLTEKTVFGKRRLITYDPIEFRRGLETASKDVVSRLDSISNKVTGLDQIRSIAMISSNHDTEIADLIHEAHRELSIGALVLRDPDPAIGDKSYVTLNKGYLLDKGYYSQSFTDSEGSDTCNLDKPRVFISKDPLVDPMDLVELVTISISNKVPIVIIAPEFSEHVMAFLVKNQLKTIAKILPILTPGIGVSKLEYTKDLCVVTGFHMDLIPKDLSKLKLENLGICESIKSDSSETIISTSSIYEDEIHAYVTKLESNLSTSTGYEKSRLESRLARLKGELAVITLSALTEGELSEKIDRLDDAIEATKSAIEGGYIPGSGIPLVRIAEELRSKLTQEYDSSDSFIRGYDTVISAIEKPFRTIVTNLGKNPDKIKNRIDSYLNDRLLRLRSSDVLNSEFLKFEVGYNGVSREVTNLKNSGIIDPTKVTKLAVKNSVSAAITLLTTNCTITNKKSKDD